jgi:hypothetical protein
MAGDTLDFGIVKTVDHDFVIRPEQPEFRVDGASRPTLRPADDPDATQNHEEQSSASENKPKPPQDILVTSLTE